MHDTVLLIGNSPFLHEIENLTEYALHRYHSIGINNIIRKYRVDEHIFQDIGIVNVTNEYPDTKTITLSTYGALIQKENKELINSYSFDFEKDTYKDIYRDNKLAWCGFTHDYALSYCIYKNWKRVILLGVADFIDGGHFVVNGKFNCSENVKRNSIRFINEIISKRIEVYNCNPNSLLTIPYIPIESLL